MDIVHLHLMLNHVPVLGTIAAALLLGYSLIKNTAEVKHLALAAALIAGLSAWPAFYTGHEAEERIEKTAAGKQVESLVESHEGTAKLALTGALVSGAAALIGLALAWRLGEAPGWSRNITLVLSIVAFGLMVRAANTGGSIAHPELRSGTAALTGSDAKAMESATSGAKDGKDKKDDD